MTRLAAKYGWKLGDRIVLQGTIYPVNLELNVRGIFHTVPDNKSVYFNSKYVEEAVPFFKGQAGDIQYPGGFSIGREKVASTRGRHVPQFAAADKTESERRFGLNLLP